MEQIKENKPLFPVFYEINREALEEAKASLVKKGKNSLVNFINACCQGKVSEANTFKKMYDDCEENINFIDVILEMMK